MFNVCGWFAVREVLLSRNVALGGWLPVCDRGLTASEPLTARERHTNDDITSQNLLPLVGWDAWTKQGRGPSSIFAKKLT